MQKKVREILIILKIIAVELNALISVNYDKNRGDRP